MIRCIASPPPTHRFCNSTLANGTLLANYSETQLTRPRITRKLAELKPSFMVPAWVMIIIIGWAYLKSLVVTRTDDYG